jgi:hypothetical protein
MKSISIFTALFLIFANISTVFAKENSNFEWSLSEDGVLTITGEGEMPEWKIAADVPWYYEREKVKSVVIGDDITTVGPYAFFGCDVLESIDLGKGISEIGSGAFTRCEAIDNITLPENLTFIDDNAFLYCTALSSITVPNGVLNIGDQAFANCTSLVEITLPDMADSLEASIFRGCSALKRVYLPYGIKIISSGSFVGCTSLEEVFIPDTVVEISTSAFDSCTSLYDISIPENVEIIGDYAFNNCTSLKSIQIPGKTELIGAFAFSGCKELESIDVSANNQFYISENNVLFNKTKTNLIKCAVSKQGKYIIPESVTGIEIEAFCGCSEITDITVPKSVTRIVGDIFVDCKNLKSITLPQSVTIIGAGVFTGCDSLNDIYYAGTEQQWNTIEIFDDGNEALKNAQVHFNSNLVLVVLDKRLTISVNGKEVDFPDAKPFIDENGRTQIPIRAVMEELDCSVTYDEETQTVSVKGNNDDINITLMIGNNVMQSSNGNVIMDTAAKIIDNRTYIPVRFVAEALGYTVNWEQTGT